MLNCSYCGKENPEVLTRCSGCGTGLVEENHAASTRPPIAEATTRCPACGTTENFTQALSLRPSFRLSTYVFTGILGIFAQNASRPVRLQCNSCGTFFDHRSTGSRAAGVLFWLMVIAAIALILLLVVPIFL